MTTRKTALLPRQRAPTPGGDAKRERILAVAGRLFFEQGVERTTMNQIVQQLGVTKPYVYYYFHDKQQILETLAWCAAVDALTSMDFAEDDTRPAWVKLGIGLERLVRSIVANHPAGFFVALDAHAFRPAYRAAQHKLHQHFRERLRALLEAGRAEGMLDFDDSGITALAACSLPAWLHRWYRPDGRLGEDEIVRQLTALALRVVGLRKSPKRADAPNGISRRAYRAPPAPSRPAAAARPR